MECTAGVLQVCTVERQGRTVEGAQRRQGQTVHHQTCTFEGVQAGTVEGVEGRTVEGVQAGTVEGVEGRTVEGVQAGTVEGVEGRTVERGQGQRHTV